MTFKITRSDIRRGTIGDPNRCPVALALKRKFPRQYVNVSAFSVRVGGIFSGQIAVVNSRLGHWIQRFDMGERVRPATFTIRLARS